MKSLAVLGFVLILISGIQMILLPLLLSDENILPFVDLWSIGIILFSSGIVFLILAFIIRNVRNKRAREITANQIQQFKDDFQKSIVKEC